MPRAKAPCGTYPAYRRHLRLEEPVDAECRAAQKAHDGGRSTSAAARSQRAAKKVASKADEPVAPPPPTPTTEDGHVSRLEILKEQLEVSRQTIEVLKQKDPSRVYLLMREQRETVREIAELQGNGQVKGVTLADQLADARARRNAAAAAS